MKKFFKRLFLLMVLLMVAIQFVPYGPAHDNPKVTQEPDWDTPFTRELAQRACFDCHSNETKWPWYSWVAPFSWLVQHDVEEGREHLNFSEWDKEQKHADEAAHEVEEGEMPLPYYTWLHGDAKLDDKERANLIRGLKATFGE